MIQGRAHAAARGSHHANLDGWPLSIAFRQGPEADKSLRKNGASRSNGGLATLPGANANDFFHWRNENLTVADASGTGGGDNGVHRAFHQRILTDDFDLHLGENIDRVFAAAAETPAPSLRSVTSASTVALGAADGHRGVTHPRDLSRDLCPRD